MRASRRWLATVVMVGAVLTLGVFVAGCGGGGSSAGEKCPAQVDATVDTGTGGALRFVPDTLSAKSGKWVVKLVNRSSISHTFQIHGFSGEADVNGSVKESCATFTLTAGDFTFFCGISGHEAAGMRGKLHVTS